MARYGHLGSVIRTGWEATHWRGLVEVVVAVREIHAIMQHIIVYCISCGSLKSFRLIIVVRSCRYKSQIQVVKESISAEICFASGAILRDELCLTT